MENPFYFRDWNFDNLNDSELQDLLLKIQEINKQFKQMSGYICYKLEKEIRMRKMAISHRFNSGEKGHD